MLDNQKLRPLVLARILLNETDELHALQKEEIIELLSKEGFKVERKTLYKDIKQLRDSGLDIISEQRGRAVYYYIGQREFELPEVKLLVDLVQSSKFITNKKSKVLIKKLESMVSKYESAELQRQVYVTGRIKSDNESIYYNVDKIHTAINQNKKIIFKYFQWGMDKEKSFKHDGKIYCVSPWALLWDNEKYYLIAYDDEMRLIKHYRVEKIYSPEISDEARSGKDIFVNYDMSTYTNQLFGMYEGELKTVKLRVSNELVGVIIDRFGKDIEINRTDDSFFETEVVVSVSKQFLGWIFSLGDDVEIVGPNDVTEMMRDMLKQGMILYKKNKVHSDFIKPHDAGKSDFE